MGLVVWNRIKGGIVECSYIRILYIDDYYLYMILQLSRS